MKPLNLSLSVFQWDIMGTDEALKVFYCMQFSLCISW